MVNSAKSSKMYGALFRNEQCAGKTHLSGDEREIGNELRASTDRQQCPQQRPYTQPQSPYENLSKTTIPLAALKTTEMELQKRWHQRWHHRLDNFFPLWFHAHTERNIYLWRHGLSIGDESLFEFWVDVAALIQKRRNKIKLDVDDRDPARAAQRQDNPLTNPNWSSGERECRTPISDMGNLGEEELRYLKDLETALTNLTPHIHALSVATCMIQPHKAQVVIIPFRIASK